MLVDFGSKHGILRELTKRGCDVVVVPYNVTAEEIRRIQPDGILLSNGPGDPKDVPQAIEMIKGILGEYPSSEFAWVTSCSLWRLARIP